MFKSSAIPRPVIVVAGTLLVLTATPVTAPLAAAQAVAQAHSSVGHPAPLLGADISFADWPHPIIKAWQDPARGGAMAQALASAGVRTVRVPFGGLYSPRGPEATVEIKKENDRTNEYEWFPIDDLIEYTAAHDFTLVLGVNVEEGPGVARNVVRRFLDRGLRRKLIAIELSNEPHLSTRPWMPEEFGARAAEIITRLTPLGVPFALPLTVGKERNTPTRLSDDQWNSRMLAELSRHVDLQSRSDIYGVLHLYARGVRAKSVDYFNREVRRFAPNMRYLVTEFNIRLNLKGNPHLTNEYALEFARQLAELMARPEIEALYVHAVPYHSIVYWSNGRGTMTVIGHKDSRLVGHGLAQGWHLTPAGRVYGLFTDLAWKGRVLAFKGGDRISHWVVRSPSGEPVATVLNTGSKASKVRLQEVNLQVNAPARSITCYDPGGDVLSQLIFPH